MDKSKLHIEEEVRKTMEMADRIQKVEGNPYLLTRVLQQVKNEKVREPGFFSSLSPAYKVAFSVFIIAINALVFFQQDKLTLRPTNNTATVDIADEYGLIIKESEELSYILEK